ncbi:hypothetical protein LCGC14_1345310 [marine sediment metagenome]|uniref:Uncharacterized protein n=1 Tax=marine sediment metagenome TaxID=412755 RepID=A0A0F9KD47_9ZZZZ
MEDNKKEFIKEELYNNMKYIVYCLEVEIDIKSCSSREGYQKFLKGTEKHYGDCTKENCTCQKCFFISIERRIIYGTSSIYGFLWCSRSYILMHPS